MSTTTVNNSLASSTAISSFDIEPLKSKILSLNLLYPTYRPEYHSSPVCNEKNQWTSPMGSVKEEWVDQFLRQAIATDSKGPRIRVSGALVGFRKGSCVFLHKFAPPSAQSYRVQKSRNKIVNTALMIDLVAKDAWIVVDKITRSNRLYNNFDALQEVTEHENVEGYLAIIPYTCSHYEKKKEQKKQKYRVYQRYFPTCLVDLLVDKNAKLNFLFAAACAHQVALGLHSLHEKGLVHRDIKPDNILTDGTTFVIIDLDEVTKKEEITKDTPRLGTKCHYPPTQAAQKMPQSQTWDLYAYTKMLWHMSRHPSIENNEVAEMLAHVMGYIDQEDKYFSPLVICQDVLEKLLLQRATQVLQEKAETSSTSEDPAG